MKDQYDPLSIKEAVGMQGTEFIFHLGDDTVHSYIKKFDPKIGLTCLSLNETTDSGDDFKYSVIPPKFEKDGTFCVVAADFKRNPGALQEALKRLAEIKATGEYKPKNQYGFNTPSCAF